MVDYARLMMKKLRVTLFALIAVFGLSTSAVTGCGGKKEEKDKTSKTTGDKAKADKPEQATGEDICAKAEKCKNALAKADPEGAKSFEQAWSFIETLEGDPKMEQCKQLLQGASFNPKAPPECK